MGTSFLAADFLVGLVMALTYIFVLVFGFCDELLPLPDPLRKMYQSIMFQIQTWRVVNNYGR